MLKVVIKAYRLYYRDVLLLIFFNLRLIVIDTHSSKSIYCTITTDP